MVLDMEVAMIEKRHVRYTIAILLIVMGTVYASGYALMIVGGGIQKLIARVMVLTGCCLLPRKNRLGRGRIKLNVKNVICFTCVLGTVISYLVNYDRNNVVDNILLGLTFVCASMISERVGFATFSRFFVNGMLYATVAALAVWGVRSIGIELPTYKYVGLNGLEYESVFFCTWSRVYPRFMGLFWEPGLYASFLTITVLFEGLFSESKPRMIVYVICTVAILLTQSTAGYLLLAFAFVIIFRDKSKREFGLFFDVVVISAFLVIYFQSDAIINQLVGIDENIFAKLTGGGLTYDTRRMSPLACLEVFAKQPLWGNGVIYATDLYNELKPVYHMDALTSSSGFMLAAIGIGGISYTIGWLKAFLNQSDKSIMVNIMMVCLFLALVNKEPHYNNVLTTTIMFVLLMRAEEKKNKQ